jgi:hypothetical protein
MNKKLGIGSIAFGTFAFMLGLFADGLDIDDSLARPLLYIGAVFGITGIVILNKLYQKLDSDK